MTQPEPTRFECLRHLGLAETASPEEIRRAYRALALKLHPDKHPNDTSGNERFVEVAEAYAALKRMGCLNAPAVTDRPPSIPPGQQVEMHRAFAGHCGCPACGHDLLHGLLSKGVMVTCPECGHTSRPAPPRRRKRDWTRLGTGAFVAASLACVFLVVVCVSYAMEENQGDPIPSSPKPPALCLAEALGNGLLAILGLLIVAGLCLAGLWCDRASFHRIFRRKRNISPPSPARPEPHE